MLRGQTGFSLPRNVRIVYVVQPRPICSRVCPITIEYADARRVFTARICFVVQRADCRGVGLTGGGAEV